MPKNHIKEKEAFINNTFKKLDIYLSKLERGDNLENDVYHYTKNFDNLISILKDKRLLMKDYAKLEEEIVYACNFLKTKIPDVQLISGVKIEGETFISFWKAFEAYRSKLRVYLCSFSLSADDQNLWRTFGRRGKGFCIRFSKNYFNTNDLTKSNPDVKVKMYYGQDELRKFSMQIEKVLSILRKEKNLNKKRYGCGELLTRIIPQLPCFLPNNPPYFFANQQEYRLYTMDHGFSQDLRIPDCQIEKINGIERVRSQKFSPENIVEVLVGPANKDFDKIKADIIEQLSDYFSKEQLLTFVKRSNAKI